MIRSGFLQHCQYALRRFSNAHLPTADQLQVQAMNENCILVNEDDNITGFALKSHCHKINKDKYLPLHRAFSVLVFNPKNELLLQKRSSKKLMYPEHISNACCGHPLYNDEEKDDEAGVKLAAQRRLQFELGIPKNSISIDSLHYLTRLHYRSPVDGMWGVHVINYILVLHKDVEINPNPDEVSDTTYVAESKFINYVAESKSPLTPWFYFLITSNCLNDCWKNLHQLDKVTEKDYILDSLVYDM